ncbi:hypothetical protein H6P81_021425 [Aristolochia fimbriata]|uniref:Uncharacterized protein n=1 Tax=Aristolochia fimbriata TaxID=158543 RepID=A0AAV7DQ09_ARIFI|nr:hypothetical protein H6P81_021425 [Aristolochia fimbriata]
MEPFPFRLQSSHLNICYYHQDLHRRAARPGSRPRFSWAAAAKPSYSSRPGCCPDGRYGSRALSPSIFGLVDSADRCGPPPEFLWLRPARHSSPSFGPGRYAHTQPFSEDLGRSTVQPARGSRQSASFAPLRVWSPADSHTCQTPGPCFKTGRMGSPLADAKSASRVPRGHAREVATPPLLGHRDDDPLGGIIRPACRLADPLPRTLLQTTYSNGRKAADSHTGLFPFAAATRGILRVFPPDLGSHPSKASGSRRQLPAGVPSEPGPRHDFEPRRAREGGATTVAAGCPWGKVFFSQPRQGGKDDHLLAPDDSPTARWVGQQGTGGENTPGVTPRQVYPDLVASGATCAQRLDGSRDSAIHTKSPPKVVVRVRPDRRWVADAEPAGRRSLTLGRRGFDGRCTAAAAAAGHRGAARSLGSRRFAESTMILPQVQWTSRNASGGRTANAAADPNTSPTIQSVGATGGVYKGQGT